MKDYLSEGVRFKKLQPFLNRLIYRYNNEMNFEDLTIIFLTKNREKYIARNVAYWSSTKAKIIVADGGIKNLKKKLFKLNKNLTYIHCQNSPEHRLYLAAEFVNTRYSIIAADDDFLLFKGVGKCIDFLNSNPTYVSALGTALEFEKNGTSVNFYSLYPENIIYGNVSEEKCWDRSNYHFSNYAHTTMYAVLKSEVFINLSQSLKGIKKLDGNLLEMIIEFSITFQGKTMVINEVTWLRGNECAPNWKTSKPIIAWFLSLINKERTKLLSALDENIFSCSSNYPALMRRVFFLKIMIGFQLIPYCDKFRISRKYKWLILPLIFLYINSIYLIHNIFNERATEKDIYVGSGRTKNSDAKIKSGLTPEIEELDLIFKFIQNT